MTATPAPEGTVVLDLQGTQSIDYRDRGIARYVQDHALAIETLRPGFASYTTNPDLPPPDHLDQLVRSAQHIPSPELAAPQVFHSMSPLELAIPLERAWPTPTRSSRLVVTLYDLIPEVFPEHYLADPGQRAKYRARLELIRSADAVLAISQSAADTATDLLGINPKRIAVIMAGTSARFVPPASRADAVAAARQAVPGLQERFILYTGGTDERKNVDRLLLAYAALPESIRSHWQLVIACHLTPPVLSRFEHRIEELELGTTALLTGYVTDEAMVRLYQGTELFVFPSLFEGYGLPLAEAMACGAPAIASNTSSLVEIVDDAATFDPSDPGAIRAAMERGLTDEVFRSTLIRRSQEPPPSWREVASKTLDVYDDLLARPAPSPTIRHKPVAFVTPLPPVLSGVATYSSKLIPELAVRAELDVFYERSGPDTKTDRHYPARWLKTIEAARGGYRNVIYTLGNSEFHNGALAALRSRPGAVLAHDVRLDGMYRLSAYDHAAVPPDAKMPTDPLMAGEVIDLATKVVATSSVAAGLLAQQCSSSEQRSKITWSEFGIAPFTGRRRPSSIPLIASFGFVNEIKQPDLIIKAFAIASEALPTARLLFVGPAGKIELSRYGALAGLLGVKDRFDITDGISDDEYTGWLEEATIAIQLRASSNGESSATIGECLAAGIPTIVTGIGTAALLPDDVVEKVPPDVTPDKLADVMLNVLQDETKRHELAEGGTRYAAECTFATAAESLLAAITD